MLSKPELKKQFAKEWKTHYQVALFKEKGFVRKTCSCGSNFWTLNPDRKVCGDPTCEPYGFLDKPITKVKWDYVETWKQFEKYFVKNKHTAIPRYPVVDRWRPDLYFTIASIQDFQRIDKGKMVFEYPANPLVVPQVCLRFPDIPNVGVTGRHNTCFIMGGQHAFGFPKEGYFKDRCIELNFGFLNGVMGIPATELTYVEDVWAMPDFSAFGPSIECFSRGLELVNHVFMEYTKKGDSYTELDIKVNDTGWGHERLVWFSNGGATSYDSVFGPVIAWMKKEARVQESALFQRYAALAAGLDYEDRNTSKIKKDIAQKLKVSVQAIDTEVAPLQALYAICDHVKTLLFAITDGGIPSNVGGGYNLRVLLRRCFSFQKEYKFPFTLQAIAERHATHLHPLFPELKGGLEQFAKIVTVEQERYEKTMGKAASLVLKEIERPTPDLLTLYTSHGVAPEMVEKIALEHNKHVQIPADFYEKVVAQHLSGEKTAAKEEEIDVSAFPPTETVYYQDAYKTEMDATVLGVVNGWVVLDRTVFYPEGGGQPADHGTLNQSSVTDVQKVGKVILHQTNGKFKKGDKVHGTIDAVRRERLRLAHDATHILVGTCRKVLGQGAWQAGAQKAVAVSRLDVTHYRPFTPEDVAEIERVANDVIKKNLPITSRVMPRNLAEQQYGFVLYQGGASPGKEIRVVEIPGHDVQACGGTHSHKTGEAVRIKIVRTERIQDGVNRLEFTAGPATEEVVHQDQMHYKQACDAFTKHGIAVKLQKEDPHTALTAAAQILSLDPVHLAQGMEKFFSGVTPSSVKGRTLAELASSLFEAWKHGRKEQEKNSQERALRIAQELAARKGDVTEVLDADRKDLLTIATEAVKTRPSLTIILANNDGDIVGASQTQDMGARIRQLCQQAGGGGGGSPRVAQGKAPKEKLLVLLKKQ